MNYLSIRRLWTVLILGIWLAGASQAEPTPEPLQAEPLQAEPLQAEPLQAEPKRIVSLLPSLTEMIFAVGAGDRVVGVTKFCSYPPEAASRAQIGGYVPTSMSFEQIVALKPDLVIAAGDIQQPAIEQLRELGLRVETVIARDVSGVVEGIRRVGRLVARNQEGERVASELEKALEGFKARFSPLQDKDRPRVFYEVWHDPPMTAGRRSFISELIQLAGGHSLFHDVDREYFQVSFEEVVVRRPEVILGAEVAGAMGDLGRLAELPGWKELPAVTSGRVHALDGDLVSRPGPRLGELLGQMADLLHGRTPDQATDP